MDKNHRDYLRYEKDRPIASETAVLPSHRLNFNFCKTSCCKCCVESKTTLGSIFVQFPVMHQGAPFFLDIQVNLLFKLNNRSSIKCVDILRYYFCTAPKPHANSAPGGPGSEGMYVIPGRNSNRQEKVVRICPWQTMILFLS